MNQRTPSGVRLIDAAKAAIEHFMLKRSSDGGYSADRFFLVTFGDSLSAFKVRLDLWLPVIVFSPLFVLIAY